MPANIALPAMALMIVGGLGLRSNFLIGIVGNQFRTPPNKIQRPADMTDEQFQARKLGAEAAPLLDLIVLAVAALACYPMVLFGGQRMQEGRSWGLALTASLMAMLPCSVACFLGVPVGMWALIVLLNPQVKAQFR